MADVHAKLDELTALIESAKSMPLSSSCVLPRADVLAVIDGVRQLLPSELAAASTVLSDRAGVMDDGRTRADALIAAAIAERDRLLADHEVLAEARQQAESLLTEAADTARLMRVEVEDYVDGRLANFEVVLQKTLAAVERGRDKLSSREPTDVDLRADIDLRGDQDLPKLG